MAQLTVELWETLQELTGQEFKDLKWFLNKDDILDGLQGIPLAPLEKAERRDTVDLMVQKYQGPGALKVTMKVLEKICRNDLVERLKKVCPEPKAVKTRKSANEIKAFKKVELQSVQQFAVDVTLDPDSAHPHLILSDDGKQVYHGDVRRRLPYSPKRFKRCVDVLGKPSFSTGKSYYEVQVKGKTAWTVGVASESIKRKEKITLSPEDGFWTIWLRNEDEYTANDNHTVRLSLNRELQKVGVFVDYEDGLVSFYDVDAAVLLYSYTDWTFTEKLYPFFSPCTNDGGMNSAPLIISSVIRDQTEDDERKKAELQSVQQFAVDVSLDPDTAHPHLILSDDGKQVYHGDVRRKLPYSPKRFKICVNVLGKPSFSKGRSYYEVQVRGKTAWTLGVTTELIDRKAKITLSPEEGFWTICLRNEDEYLAIENPAVHLPLKSNPEKVGVFLDYEEGRVSFYDVDSADLLYSFTGCTFTDNILPFFSPCTNDGGQNSAPLVICPVNVTD